jgi:UDP-N-acetylmuramoyl-tripeptide--D-alanyl-D-alanine ligase
LNALAAAAVGTLFDLDLDAVAAGLAEAPAVPMRMQRILHPSGAVIVNDAYNANPTSMAAALETFLRMAKGQRTILVLGDMLELGSASEAAHRRIGASVGRTRPGRLITVGERARAIGEEAARTGLDATRIHACRDHAEARAILQSHLRQAPWILLKASRGVGLERALERL